MAYTNYEFYTTEYYGDVVPKEKFPKYIERACNRIDDITFDRLVDGLPSDQQSNVRVQKAVCAVADVLYLIETVRKASIETVGTIKREDGSVTGKQIASLSSGSESISYVTGTNGTGKDIYSQAAMNKQVENVLIRQAATEYLQGVADANGVNLLYAGVR